MINNPSNYLARLVYDIGVKKQIEERVEAKYSKRIEYLVNANDELMYELEQCELECYGRGHDT
jgi:demethoxyubiquinone hydroxylase (CLK1/Coq7/Cat5 family)|tara:strand:- start:41 stop:229 length:189 start_codon:yes stop_codon:yes gene_type:complete